MATEAPLEKSRIEWTDANRIFLRGGCSKGTQPSSFLKSAETIVIDLDINIRHGQPLFGVATPDSKSLKTVGHAGWHSMVAPAQCLSCPRSEPHDP